MKKPFTLIEALITLALISIILVVAIPKSNLLDGNTLNLAGRHLKANLNHVRSLAIQNKSNYVVKFSLSDNSYRVLKDDKTIDSPFDTGLYTVSFDGSAYNGVEIFKANFKGLNQVEFTSTGALVDDGEIILKNKASQIKLTAHILTGKFDVN